LNKILTFFFNELKSHNAPNVQQRTLSYPKAQADKTI